jgi:hypothetical protein
MVALAPDGSMYCIHVGWLQDGGVLLGCSALSGRFAGLHACWIRMVSFGQGMFRIVGRRFGGFGLKNFFCHFSWLFRDGYWVGQDSWPGMESLV